MVQAYRLLIQQMDAEFGECYPLHLGVTEAGDGEDGRVKSAAGTGTLLEDGIGDTVRVSLTEDPEFEIPVCRDLVKRYSSGSRQLAVGRIPSIEKNPYSPFNYSRRETFAVDNMGGHHAPAVIADLSKIENVTPQHLESIGYKYDETTDKWNISDTAADYIFTGHQVLNFSLPGTLKVIVYPATWHQIISSSFGGGQEEEAKYFPIFDAGGYVNADLKSDTINFVMIDCFSDETAINDFTFLEELANDRTVVICLSSLNNHAMPAIRRMFIELMNRNIQNPAIIICDSYWQTADEHLIHYATECGALLLDGFGDGICLGMNHNAHMTFNDNGLSGRRYSSPTRGGREGAEQFINATAFSILQATRTRISKTEYISCPSCGRTLFDLQETTARIRSVTNHLKGVKIAIMGCIVNGPGEMADADFGYVGSGVGKITLYKGKEVVKRNVDSAIAVDELINLLRENDVWVEPLQVV
jgi:(E)-4-hydroxy-3-methylbut-2-enyl-diphosphate synthase